MKVLKYITLPIILFVAITCSESAGAFEESLTVSPREISVPIGGFSEEAIYINAVGIWNLRDRLPDWIIVDTVRYPLKRYSEGETDTIKFQVPQNVVLDRDTYLVFTTGIISDSVYISQTGIIPNLQIRTDDLSAIPHRPDDLHYKLEIQTNTRWILKSVPSWITFSETSGTGDATLTMTFANNLGRERESEFTVNTEAGNLSETVTVTQLGIEIDIDTESLPEQIPASGGPYTVRLSVNDTWRVADAPLWAVCETVEGEAGVHDINIDVAANDSEVRTGRIRFQSGTVSTDIELMQLAGSR